MEISKESRFSASETLWAFDCFVGITVNADTVVTRMLRNSTESERELHGEFYVIAWQRVLMFGYPAMRHCTHNECRGWKLCDAG